MMVQVWEGLVVQWLVVAEGQRGLESTESQQDAVEHSLKSILSPPLLLLHILLR
jgi:hypothetical protein